MQEPASSSSCSSNPSPIQQCRPRRQSVSIAAAAAANRKDDDSYLTAGTSLTPWKSADSLISTSHEQSSSSPSSSSRKKDMHNLITDNVPWSITQRLRKFSLSRPTSSSAASSSSSKHPMTPTVVETHTINKDYDPTTGNKILNNKYMIVREIGRGVHGKVKLAEDIESHDLVAIKIVDKRARQRQLGYNLLRGGGGGGTNVNGSGGHMNATRRLADQYRENEQKIRREIAILKKCAHPHVVRLLEVMDDPASHKLYMALEYMEGGEIQWRDENEMPVMGMEEARSIFRSVVSGLDYLHYQGIIHRDIKPANLLLTRDRVVKISDFGVSYLNEHLAGNQHSIREEEEEEEEDGCCDKIDRELAETAGTPAFFAPELCSTGGEDMGDISNTSHRRRHRITKAIDIWALGVTLYCFAFGRCPFTAANEFELFNNIPRDPLQFPDPNEIGFDISDALKDLLYRLLTKDPEKRITLEQVKHHPWVIEDLGDPEQWWQEADPCRYKAVEVTDDEVNHAVTMMDRIRKSIQKLSSSLSHLTQGITRKRSKTVSYSSTNDKTTPPPSAPQSATPTSGSKNNTKHIQNHSSPSSYHRPHSSLSDDTMQSSRYPLEHQPSTTTTSYEENSSGYYGDDRPTLDREVSTASSSSDMPIMIGRYRGGLDLKG
ncbi:upstream serine threonine kinase for the snf1complex [Lichtheimia corymbifera JMRC:FSU:9682]|uniref:Upstream serine threonine kinase for the snf1complex n=1 Tax=Lichtheimia corymbifera JMRC:FSU:9682 TaxID=1263082 RepID=A0A068RLG9_9FUNG|nr:upstream serine threonine kinase for the snf1complex [Lichtheimia corymbifera JMRC:FSU:9682]